MLVSTVDVAAVIEGVAQRYGGRLTIDLPASPYVDFTRALSSVNLTAQMSTDLPDGVRDVQGLSTLTGDIVISGSVDPQGDETKSAAWLFNPDSPDSPLRHLTVNDCRIVYEEGPYVAGSKDPQYLPASGECWINGYDLDHEAGTVTFHVTDLPPDWDAVPSIPSVITVAPFNSGLTSEFVMDAVVRSMYGDSTWPATRPQCVLAVGGRSSAWAEVGRLVGVPNTALGFAPGVYGTAFAPFGLTDTLVSETVYELDDAIRDDVYIEWVAANLDVSNSSSVSAFNGPIRALTDALTVQVDTDAVFVTVDGAGGGTNLYFNSIPAADSHKVAVQVHWPIGGTTWSATVTVDGVVHSSGSLAAGFTRASVLDHGEMMGFGLSPASFEAVQVTMETAAVPSWPFTPRAVLDPSLNPLTVTPPVPADTNGWDLLQTIAAAECGYIRKGRDGIIRFTNRQNMLNADVGRAISKTSLRTFATTVPPSGAYRRIQVPYTEWEFGDPAAIFTLQTNKKIPAGKTITWQQPLDNGALAANITPVATLLPDGADPTDGGSYYRSSADRHGAAAGPKLTVLISQPSPGVLEVSAHNPSSRHAYLTTPSTNTDFDAGSIGSGLWIGGTPVTAGDEATVECVYGDGRGTLQFGSNAYLQDHDTAVAVGNFLLGQLFMTIRDFTGVSIVPDLRAEPSDIDRLVNPDPSGVDEYVIVWGWSYSAEFPPAGQDGGSRDMTLDVRALGAPDAWLIGSISDRGDIDNTAWLYV